MQQLQGAGFPVSGQLLSMTFPLPFAEVPCAAFPTPSPLPAPLSPKGSYSSWGGTGMNQRTDRGCHSIVIPCFLTIPLLGAAGLPHSQRTQLSPDPFGDPGSFHSQPGNAMCTLG